MDQVFAVRQVCEKYLANGKMYSWRVWIWKRPKRLSIAWYAADAKSVWSLRKIVENLKMIQH